MDLKYNNLIYLTGHCRGGTTWLGKLLSMHPDTHYIFEPFISTMHPYTGIDTFHLFSNGRCYKHLKQGNPIFEQFTHTFFPEPDDKDLDDFKDLVKLHLNRLIEKYFSGEKINTLIIKQPRQELAAWSEKALNANYVIVVERHPFGIINSYQKIDAFSWIEFDWLHALKTIPQTHPELMFLFEEVSTDYEKLLVLTYIRQQILKNFQGRDNWMFINYEDLCEDAIMYIKKIIKFVGLSWNSKVREKIGNLISNNESNSSSNSVFDTRKNSIDRMNAWRFELSKNVQEQLCSFVKKKNLDIALPGDVLEPLSLEEHRLSNQYNRKMKIDLFKEIVHDSFYYNKRTVKKFFKNVLN